jgi:hypothetical protein
MTRFAKLSDDEERSGRWRDTRKAQAMWWLCWTVSGGAGESRLDGRAQGVNTVRRTPLPL